MGITYLKKQILNMLKNKKVVIEKINVIWMNLNKLLVKL
jgi:hypothetical protein